MPALRLDDVELHYETFGSGPAMLLLAATAWHGAAWKLHQTSEFARDHRVIIFDQRGTGASVASSKDFSTARLVADALALLRHLGVDRTIVLGHSNGGRVAQLLAADHPEIVDKLILASAGATHPGKGVPVELCVELVEKGYERAVLEQFMQVGFSPEYVARHPDRVEALRRVRMDRLPPLEILLRHVVGRRESDTSSRLKDIRAPTLVMIGSLENDTSSDVSHYAFAEILARDIANARRVVLEGQGHYYLFVEPERSHRAIRDFLGA
jgi:pimeloyl-ACP methyl ester carboxylesterase